MTIFKRTFVGLFLAAVFILCAHVGYAKDKAGKNPLKQEMRYLDAAFGRLLSGIALEDLSAVAGSFEGLHEYKEETEKALERGDLTLPKNNDKLRLFKQLDDNFHKELEFMLNQAKANDAKAVKASAIRLLDSCIECHRMFRK